MNSVDSTPLAAGGNGRNREHGGFGTCGGREHSIPCGSGLARDAEWQALKMSDARASSLLIARDGKSTPQRIDDVEIKW